MQGARIQDVACEGRRRQIPILAQEELVEAQKCPFEITHIDNTAVLADPKAAVASQHWRTAHGRHAWIRGPDKLSAQGEPCQSPGVGDQDATRRYAKSLDSEQR